MQLILLPIKTVGGKIYYIWIVELDHLGLLSKSGTADHIIFLSVPAFYSYVRDIYVYMLSIAKYEISMYTSFL